MVGRLDGDHLAEPTPRAAGIHVGKLCPALLLELRSQHGVIRAQWPIAVILLPVNLVIMSIAVVR